MTTSKAANLLIFNEQTFPSHFPESSRVGISRLSRLDSRLSSRFSLKVSWKGCAGKHRWHMSCIHFHELSTSRSRLDRVSRPPCPFLPDPLIASLSFWSQAVGRGRALPFSFSLSAWDVYIILLLSVVPSWCSLSGLHGGRQGRRELQTSRFVRQALVFSLSGSP